MKELKDSLESEPNINPSDKPEDISNINWDSESDVLMNNEDEDKSDNQTNHDFVELSINHSYEIRLGSKKLGADKLTELLFKIMAKLEDKKKDKEKGGSYFG